MKRQLSIAARLPVGQAKEQHRAAVANERACRASVEKLAQALKAAREGLKLATLERIAAEDDLESVDAAIEAGEVKHVRKAEPIDEFDPLHGGRA